MHMSAFGGKADMFDRKADIELAPITVFIGSCGWVRIVIPRSMAYSSSRSSQSWTWMWWTASTS